MPAVPSVLDVREMTSRQQQKLLRRALADLDEELDSLPTGDGWKKFLQLDVLGSSLWCGNDAEPDDQSRKVLSLVESRFRQVHGDPQLQAIRDMRSFQSIHNLLSEFATDPIVKTQRRLQTSVATLDDSLSRLKDSAGWKKYLRTEELRRLATQSEQLELADQQRLREIMSVYDGVEKNPAYLPEAVSTRFMFYRAGNLTGQ
jgi:hypothetical protein